MVKSNNITLNNIKNEIENRKKTKNQEVFGSNVTEPKDAFLNGLLESLQSGRQNSSVNHLKEIANKATEKKGLDKKLTIIENNSNSSFSNNEQYISPSNYRKPINIQEDDISREEQMFNNFQNSKKVGLAESIENFGNNGNVGKRMNEEQFNNRPPQQSMLNEEHLIETVYKVVNNCIGEGFQPLFEEGMNNVIVEMFAVERIKKVMQENKEIIKGIVYEVLREIQAKSKAKQQAQ